MNKPKIAIVTAFIGNGGKTGELKFTSEALKQLDDYGVDIYRFNNENLHLLKPHFEPEIAKEEIIKENMKNELVYTINKFKYKQKIFPTEEDNYNRLIAKIPKILFYKLIPNNYDYYIWLDSKFTIHKDWLFYVYWLIEHYGNKNIITSKHSDRKSVNEEFRFMLYHFRKQSPGMCEKYIGLEIIRQYNAYKGKFNDSSLFELTMIIYSKGILNIKQFTKEWYAHNYYYTIQDQISFAYLSAKHKLNIWSIPHSVFNMPFSQHEYGIK